MWGAFAVEFRERLIAAPDVETRFDLLEIGLMEPIATVDGGSGPRSAIDTRRMTNSASMIGSSTRDIEVSGVLLRDVRSIRTRTSVCIAMPPRRLPTAMLRLPRIAADAVIATSGSVPAMPRRIRPPIASPRWKRSSSTSVLSARNSPANHVAAVAAKKMTPTTGVLSPPTARA